ncbi:MAG: imidazolonepropionase [Chlamydiales bacterium]|jgi:imidazolonepropionase
MNKVLIGPFSQIVTMDGLNDKGHLQDDDLTVIENAGVLVQSGMIIALGEFSALSTQADKIHELTAPSVLVPGFIDVHTHICFAGSRASDYALRLSGKTYQEIAARGGGILDTVRKTREATKEELIANLLERTEILLRRGITTSEVKSGYGLSVESEIKMLEAINEASSRQPVDLLPTCLAAHTRPWEFSDPKEYLDYLSHDLLPLLIEKKLTNRIDIFVEEGAFSLEESRAYLLNAESLGFSLSLHADQFTRGGALLAAELGAQTADHLEQSTMEDLQALAKAGVTPVALPGASLGLGMRFAPARQMLDCNLPLVIASDWNPGSAPMGDLLTQAAILGTAEKLTMAETLAAITCRAAKALSLTDRGLLKAGMRADMVVFPCKDYREILYHQGSMKPSQIFVKGQDY